MDTEKQALRQTPIVFNVGQRVEYRGVYLRIEAEIIALDCDKWGNCMALLQPLDGTFPMWREVSRCTRMVQPAFVAMGAA